jgi:DNA-binding transcriptional LysR family regulator
MDFYPKLDLSINGHTFSYKFFETLKCVALTWSQREAARRLGISHAVLNRRIREAEDKLGIRLVETTGAGSGLSEDGLKVLQQYNNYLKRLQEHDKPIICGGHISTGLLDVLTSEYGLDARIYEASDEDALYMADMDMIDILTLDDPVRAFMHDLPFVPIAYDHLVLVSGSEVESAINSVNDLQEAKFVEIPGSSQRLAWNTLDNQGIDYKIVKLVNSPYEALKEVENSENLYTFLNSSFTAGGEILKKDTTHLITLVLLNREDPELKEFLEYISGKGQEIVSELGFERI